MDKKTHSLSKVDINLSEKVINRRKSDPRVPVGASYAKHKIVVMSGKGGVGKSTIAANLAVALARMDNKVGIIDFDFTGPSIPKMLGIEDAKPKTNPETKKLIPVEVEKNLIAISLSFFIKPDAAIIWRGPQKFKAIQNFLSQVEWGSLDYLVMDLPPGTSDEPITVAQQIPDSDGVIIVTTPQDVATQDVRKSIIFASKMKMPVIGVIENMSGFTCPHCGENTAIFNQFGGKRLAESMQVNFLGSIPLDPDISEGGDKGEPFVNNPDSSITKEFNKLVINLDKQLKDPNAKQLPTPVF